jgi:hypothetical protein
MTHLIAKLQSVKMHNLFILSIRRNDSNIKKIEKSVSIDKKFNRIQAMSSNGRFLNLSNAILKNKFETLML